MAVTTQERTASQQERVAVRVVDSDLHPTPRAGALTEYIPEPYRSTFWKRYRPGTQEFYDAPDYGESKAMRLDAFPEDGGFPGSDPDMAFRHVIMEAGCDIAILEPLGAKVSIPELNQSMEIAVNHWLVDNWLDGKTNWHERWRGSISVAIDEPSGAAKEIEHWAGHPYLVQVMIPAEPRPAWGDPKYDPVWEAATRHGLPVTCHLGRGSFELLPMSPVGYSSYNHDFMVTYSLLAANQIMSLIYDGVFERFPTLQILLVEHAYSWILPLMWRMDAVYEARKSDLPLIKRKPSEYVYDHIWFTTQPLDFPDDRSELAKALEWMEANRLLLFSTDYPHWTFDDPKWVIRQIPEQLREAIMFENGIKLFNLPRTVPAIEGQTRVW
jgi:predicted TIM-barrel fold metal-dependent hydrolase